MRDREAALPGYPISLSDLHNPPYMAVCIEKYKMSINPALLQKTAAKSKDKFAEIISKVKHGKKNIQLSDYSVNVTPIHPLVRYHQKLNKLRSIYGKEVRSNNRILYGRKVLEESAHKKEVLDNEAGQLAGIKIQDLYNRGLFSYTAAAGGIGEIGSELPFRFSPRLKSVVDFRNNLIGYDITIPSVAKNINEVKTLIKREDSSFQKLAHLANFFHLSSNFVTKLNLEENLITMFSTPPQIASYVMRELPHYDDDS